MARTDIAAVAADCHTTYRHSERARRQVAKFAAFALLFGYTIEPFQRLILLEVFDGRRELLVLIPRGNGKTSLFALWALWHLLTHPAPQVYLAAASVEQAEIAFTVIQRLVREHATLRKRVKAQHRRLVRLDGAGFLKVISSDAGRQHGLMPTLALVDELHAHKNGDLYVALKTAMLKNADAQLVTISTAGHDQQDTLGQQRAAAVKKGTVEQGGPRLRIARIAESNFCMLEWACTDQDDLTDPDVVKLANPATFVTRAGLLEQIHSPGLHPVELATYHANVWRAGADCWLEHGLWDALLDADAGIPDGADVWLAVDIGLRNDTSAIATVHRRDDGRYVVRAEVLAPPGGGRDLDLALVEKRLRALGERYHVREVAYDRMMFERSAQQLRDEGLLMIEMPQSNERMSPACQGLYEGIRSRRIVHDGDPILAAHVHAGVTRETDRGWRISKGRSTHKIDALIALVMAYSRADRPVADDMTVEVW